VALRTILKLLCCCFLKNITVCVLELCKQVSVMSFGALNVAALKGDAVCVGC
jgi:hypothetical protein